MVILAMAHKGVALIKIGEVRNFIRVKVTHIPAKIINNGKEINSSDSCGKVFKEQKS